MKHKRSDRPIKKNINIPESIVQRVDEQLIDPLSGKPEFAAYSRLITSLLAKWLNGEVKVPTPLRTRPRPFCHLCLLDRELMSGCNNPDCPEVLTNEEHPPEAVSD